MTEPITLGSLGGKLAGSLTSAVVPKAKRVWAERSAGKAPLTPRQTLLEKGFNATLSRLTGGDVEESWWRRLWDGVGHPMVTPDFLAAGDVQVWLQDPTVQADIKHLARAALLETKDDPDVRLRLQDLHSKITGVTAGHSEDLIEALIAILLAGYVADMAPADERLAGIVVETGKATQSVVDRVGDQVSAQLTQVTEGIERLGPDHYVVETHADRALEQLERIKKQRNLLPDQSREEIRHLATSVLEGDLRHAGLEVQSEVLTWAARLSTNPSCLDEARRRRQQLVQLDRQADTRIVDALILQAEGAGEAALRTLRDLPDPDARSTFLAILRTSHGLLEAIEWLDAEERSREPNFFTGIGCYNLALALAEAERWEEAADYLAQVHERHDEWPDLAFLEGLINTGLLLPIEKRSIDLDLNRVRLETRPLEGPTADIRRQCAIESFQRATQLPLPRGRKIAAEDAALWLRLTHPDPEIREPEKRAIRRRLEDPKEAIYLLPMARELGIKFDLDILWNHLSARKRLGGLDDDEARARLIIAQMKLSPRGFLELLETEESELSQALSGGTLIFNKIDALMRDGQFSRAKSLLRENRGRLDDQDSRRMAAAIAEREGQDPRQQLEDIYAETGELLDLKNLVSHLGRAGDWKALIPRARDLLERERNLFNALQYAEAMYRGPDSGHEQVLAFLEDNRDFVDREPSLQAVKAKALFYEGKIQEAKAINDRVLESRDSADDLHLDINLALQSGGWERFSGIVEREWHRREARDPSTLMRLATLAATADSSSNRAFELLKLAAAKANDDPQILTGALSLAFKLGREGKETGEWLTRAVALSSDDGPVNSFDLRSVVQDIMPKRHEEQRAAEAQWLRGEIPFNVATHAFGAPLSRLLVGIPRNNMIESDGRHRTLIPIVSGARNPVRIDPGWALGFDLPPLLILAQLGLLEQTIHQVKRVLIAPETMVLLLNERSRVLFHQPSRVETAESLRGYIDAGRLKVMNSLPKPRQHILDEVGQHLAQMLQAAQDIGGRVITPRPIHKARGFMREPATLGDYDKLAVSTVDFESLLYEDGLLDTETHEKAFQYLALQDKGGSDRDRIALDGPLFLDDISVYYLNGAGLLSIVANSDLDLRVHSSLRDEQNALIAVSREGKHLAESIDSLRIALRDALECGAVGFLRRHDPTEEERRLFEFAPTLTQLVRDDDDRDAVCLDDRYLNKIPRFIDSEGRSVPIVCVLDILSFLENQGALSERGRWRALHKLRLSGFALVPVEREELLFYLRSLKRSEAGPLVESRELLSIRQYFARMRSLSLIQIPEEAPYLGRLQETGASVIREIWRDEEITNAQAAVLSEWVWHHFMPSPLDWVPIATGSSDAVLESFARYLSVLLRPRIIKAEERERCYLKWIDQSVLRPLLAANVEVIEKLTVIMGKHIEEWSLRFG